MHLIYLLDMSSSEPPSLRRVGFVLLLPAALLTVLIIGYVASVGGAVSEEQLRGALPYLIAVNHTLVFTALLLVLKREGRGLRSIGWRLESERGVVREVIVGLAAGLALYLLKELAFDSIRALFEGSRPTFTTLFRFRPRASETPLLAVATTFVVVEESVYRGYGLPPLVRRVGAAPGLLLMGALFGVLHWGNGVLAIFFTGTLGVLFGVLFLNRRTLVAPVVAHALYNALVVLT